MQLRVVLVMGLAALLASAPASAAPPCEPLAEADFIGLVLGGQSAVDRGNPDIHRGIVDEIRRRIPCLTFAPRPRLLADYFVLEALAEFGEQGEWTAPLDAALRLRPGVDRGVGGAHPMSRHTPTPSTVPGRPVPETARVFVDGELAVTLPPPGELHLVQVNQGSLWRSAIVRDEPVDDAFLLDVIQAPLALRPWGHASLVVGAGGAVQRRGEGWPDSLGQNDFIPDKTWLVAWPALVASGGIDYGRLTLHADIDVGLAALAYPIGSHLQGVASLRVGIVRIGAGAGLGGSTWLGGDLEGSDTAETSWAPTTVALAYGVVGAWVRADGWDGGLSIGHGPAASRAAARWALVLPLNRTDTPLRLGASGVAQLGHFAQTIDEIERATSTVTFRAGLEVGLGR